MISKPQRRTGAGEKASQSAERKGRAHVSIFRSKSPSPRESLTSRERAVLKQIASGASSKEAAATLGVSPRTIDFHRANIMRKLSAKKIVDLMLLATKASEDS